jgi:penicillin amidase
MWRGPGRVNGCWRDWPRGLLVMAGWIMRDFSRGAPKQISAADRLAMLPTQSLPLGAQVTIRWDRHQIPFIEAESDRDLAVALGAVHAHLRLGQIEIMRRAALGRISEMVGPLGIEADRAIRLMALNRAVPEMIARLPGETRQWAEGFLDGINHHLAYAAALPREFDVLAIRPEPWTLTDLMTLFRLSSADISWLVWSRLLRLRDWMPQTDWSSLWPRLVSSGAPAALDGERAEPAAWACAQMARTGSNTFAVSGSRTATGAALIASDPHLPYGLPNPWIIVGMRSPSYHCVGLMMPGLPFVALGRNPDAAWGGTSLHAQSSDLFDVSDLPEQDVAEHFETIRVRGAPDRRLRLRRTVHGPIVSEGRLLPSRRRLALRWMGHKASDELSAMLAVARSTRWETFRDALKGFGVSGLNIVFAGRDGRVGHLLAAHIPRRPAGLPGDLHQPLSAASSWESVADSSDLPVRTGPDHPIVVSANERPDGTVVPVGFFFAPHDRSRRIAERLDGTAPVGIAEAQAIQIDVLARRSLRLRDLLVQMAPRPRRARERRLLAVVTGWDGCYGRGSKGALAFELLLAGVIRRLRLGPLRAYDAVWMTQVLIAEELCAIPTDRLRRAVARALGPTAARLERYGDWGTFHRIALKHPLGRLPLIGRRYRTPDFAADGGNNTVHKTGHRLESRSHHSSFGSCARHISELSDPDANLMVLLGGQDGWFGSENFDDQTALWQLGEYIRVPLRLEAQGAHHIYVTVLNPSRGADRNDMVPEL